MEILSGRLSRNGGGVRKGRLTMRLLKCSLAVGNENPLVVNTFILYLVPKFNLR